MADDLTKELIDSTTELIEQFKVDLIQLLLTDRKLKNDSRTINSLNIVINESSKYVSLNGVDYIYYVIHGRGPGRFPPPDPITGKWTIPFPVALEIAKKGNRDKYLHVANAFDKLYDEFYEKVKKQAGKIALTYALKIGTLQNVG